MFWHFLKVVYSRACESRGVWIKVRKLKIKKLLTKANTYDNISELLLKKLATTNLDN